jgi:hypothetical protein
MGETRIRRGYLSEGERNGLTLGTITRMFERQSAMVALTRNNTYPKFTQRVLSCR